MNDAVGGDLTMLVIDDDAAMRASIQGLLKSVGLRLCRGLRAALLTAAVIAGLSAIVVAIQMRLARGRSSSQTVSAVEEEERSVSKPIVSAASVRAAPLVFDAARTPDAAAGDTEREESCSA